MKNFFSRRAHGTWVALGALAAWGVGPLGAQVTEFPETIAPGRVLIRMDAISVGIDRERTDDNRFTALALASTLVAAGITPDVDFQVGMDLFLRQTIRLRGKSETHSGLGDVRLRTKWTFWRDAEWGAAAAIIPYVKVPTHRGGVSNDHVEGGVIVPWASRLDGGFSAGAMAEIDLLRNDANNGYDARGLLTGFARHELTKLLTGYAEATFDFSSAGSAHSRATLGAGATLDVSPHVQWDYGLARGLSPHATDWVHTLRLRWRF